MIFVVIHGDGFIFYFPDAVSEPVQFRQTVRQVTRKIIALFMHGMRMLLGGADGGEHFCLREFLLVQNFLHGLDVQPFKTSAAQGVPGVRKVPGGVGGENGAELAGVCPAVDFDGRGLHRNQDSLVRRAEKGFRFIPDGAHGSSGKFVVYQNPVVIRHGGVRAEQAVAPQQGFRLIRRGLHGFSDDLDACGAGGIRHGSTGVE